MTSTPTQTPTGATQRIDLEAANASLAEADALEVVRWAAETFGERTLLTSSFGAQSAVMLHLVTRVQPDVPVLWIDTGYLFPETYRFADELTQRLKLNLKVYQPAVSPARMEAMQGRLWEGGEDELNQYDQVRKVEPMQRAMDELNPAAWYAGLRGGQTDFRAGLRKVEFQSGVYKVLPILDWSTKQVHEYLTKHDLPYHPLYEQGYASIGDVHSSRPITDEEHERAGRFRGLKQECGIHLPASKEEAESRDSSGL